MADSVSAIQEIQAVRIAEWLDALPGKLRIADRIYEVGDLIDLSEEQCIVRLAAATSATAPAGSHPYTLFVLDRQRLDRLPPDMQKYIQSAGLAGAPGPLATPALERADAAAETEPAPKPATGNAFAPGADDSLDDTGTGAETQAAEVPATPATTQATPRADCLCSVLQRPAAAGAVADRGHYLLFDDQPGLELLDWFRQRLQESGLPADREAMTPSQIPEFLRQVAVAMNFLFDAYECLGREKIVWQNIGPLFLIPDPTLDGGYRLETTALRRFRPQAGAGYPERTWHRLYAAPEAHNGQGLTAKSDVFTAGIALYSLLVGCDLHRWEIGGEAQMLPTVRTFWRQCPAGLLPVLQELLHHDECARPSLAEARARVADALRRAADERLYRCGAPADRIVGTVRTFESSAMTLNGWVKELRSQQPRNGMFMSRPNQDAAFLSERIDNVRLLGVDSDPAPAALAVVADGISTCRFGRGELASESVVNAYSELWRLWLEGLRANLWSWESDPGAVFAQTFNTRWSLERSVDAGAGRFMRRLSFPHLVAECIRRATLRIWSLVGAEVKSMPNADPAEIMGSTMISAFVHGNRVTLANLGDSRAYLVSPGADPDQVWTIECLTCDHDEKHRLFREESAMPQHMLGLSGLESLTNGIGSLVSMERQGAIPNRRSGNMLPYDSSPGAMQALREGRPCAAWRPAYQRLTPDFYTLRVKPQDVLILCSDGLIDERAALMPQETAQIVTEYQDAPADHLAMQLVKAANDMQEWPSKGDNITAVVLKFHG